ncbi:MAG: L-aspartate oxidase [Nitrospirae bacterium]|nr:L-aspartate oxidase [Nitrospirota bacterium]
MKTDFLIIGSGIAGLRTAIELSIHGKVLIVTKDRSIESSSSYAQGGIAVVTGEDDTSHFHIEDTLKAGYGLCKKQAVKALVEEGPELVSQIIEWGVRFDKSDGKYLAGLEGAHSRRRILHFKDSTGEEIVKVLRSKALESNHISKLSKHFIVDLIIRDGTCKGAILLNENSGEIFPVAAKAVIIATGGAGQIFLRTSNPSGATGDGIAAAYRSGAVLEDMEFVQFHPTSFALKGAPSFLITEALRGEGALLRNVKKKRFMPAYHPLAELAPRDEVSRSIIYEMKKTNSDFVLLDATRIKSSLLRERFPTAWNACKQYGIDITKDMIPVSPAAHFIIGGIKTDIWGRTSVPGLFAAGEAACTGVHGANRLASNSLLEGLVFGKRTGISALGYSGGIRINREIRIKDSDFRLSKGHKNQRDKNVPPILNLLFTDGGPSPFADRRGFLTPPEKFSSETVKEELKKTMWQNVGIIRSESTLKQALKDIICLLSSFEIHGFTRKELEAVNMLNTAMAITLSALKRKESVGTNFREDFPEWSGKVKHFSLKVDRLKTEGKAAG